MLDNLKIGAKVGGGIGIIFILLIMLGTIGIYQLRSVNKGYSINVENKFEASSTSLKINADILEVRRSEKNFMARQNLTYVQHANQYLDNIINHINNLEPLEISDQVHSQFDQALANVAGYRAVLAEMAKVSEQRGLDQNCGLRDQFRDQAHHLSAMMANFDSETVRYWMLMGCRYEKDMVINSANIDKKRSYFNKFQNVVSSGQEAIEASSLEAQTKRELSEIFKNYNNTVTA